MKIHLVTIGKPKLAYAKHGWEEYLKRLSHFHQIQVTHLADKWASSPDKIIATAGTAHLVALVIDGPQLSSNGLARFLEKAAQEGRELCFVIGGPDGLPKAVIERAQTTLSFSKFTFPHDLAMVILVEALYRASSITAGTPYHH